MKQKSALFGIRIRYCDRQLHVRFWVDAVDKTGGHKPVPDSYAILTRVESGKAGSSTSARLPTHTAIRILNLNLPNQISSTVADCWIAPASVILFLKRPACQKATSVPAVTLRGHTCRITVPSDAVLSLRNRFLISLFALFP